MSSSSSAPTGAASLRILVLGGTAFVGRATVEAALGAGHHVTLFNRGLTNPDLFPEAEHLRGDRSSDLAALTTPGRAWDAVIDVATYHPGEVARSTVALADRVGRYVFVSTLSVYASHATTAAQLEDGGAVLGGDLTPDTDPGPAYGTRKARAEAVVLDAFGDRAVVARSGLLAGPHDPTGRFVYWPQRLAAGGRVLAPGRPDDPVQVLDVRDLADWLVLAACSPATAGVYNVAGRSGTMGELLATCRVPGAGAELVWIPTDRLLAAGVEPWMGVPLWIAAPGWEAANTVDISRATAAGLRHRPLAETVAGALAHATTPDRQALPAEAEQDLLARLA
jgi:2'-hydroxyisoflavone reductase